MSTRGVPFGKYHLLERINVGGMAEVYKAKMIGVEGFEKLLAIKRILPAIAADKDFINMFIDEAKISVQLNHANIAQTFELGRLNDTYYIALEYVPGRDLRAVFERMRRRNEVVPPELACYVISRVAEGLDYAHRKKDVNGRELGIIHRDISPQNVLVSYEGEVKIIDFGIAKAANKIMKTQAGILKGKFGYMSPEQVRGLPLDRRSDIFAAGIVLYELLVGDRLFTGDSDYSILEKVRAANVPRPSTIRKGVPGPLERIVGKALAKEPDERYQHASELVADLQRYLLAQDRLFTREELAAYMKSLFAEEFEREKRSLAEEASSDETPVGPMPSAESQASVPVIRASSMRADARPRLEGGPARPLSPPPPPADAFLNDEPRGLQPLRAGRIASAAQAAETDKVNLVRAARLDEEEVTTTETDPDAQLAELQRAARRPPPPPPEEDDGTPTPPDAGAGSGMPVPELPTRIGRQPSPPPIASAPGPARGAAAMSLPPRPARLPAITDNLPPPQRRAPPPIEAVDDEDEPTVLEDSPARRKPPAVAPAIAVKAPAKAPAARKPATPSLPARLSIGDDDSDESTEIGQKANAYKPRRKQNWAIVPLAGLAALALAFGFFRWRAMQQDAERELDAAPAPTAATIPDAPAPGPANPIFAKLTVVTEPSDALLYVDEKLVKSTGDKPWTTERLEPDANHVVIARKEGFREAATSVTLAAGGARELTLRLKPKGAVLKVTTTPPGAQISVDGRELGRAPESIASLRPGRYVVRAELKCYAAVEREVTLGEDGSTLELTLQPEPGACLAPRPSQRPTEPGLLRLMSRPAARVFVDGNDIGRETPLIDYPLPAGKHSIRLVAGKKSEDFDLDVEPGRPVTKVVVLK